MGTNSYRYGFNAKELDKSGEFGSLTHYDYGFRIYNPSIGKFFSVDPLTSSYPWYTPYQFAGNKPIWAVDLDGLEERFATSPRKDNYEARDQSAPNQIINPHPFNKPLVSIVGEDEIGPYSYYGKNPSAFIHNRKIELFRRTGQALQNGGIITSIYYQTSDPSLQELETVSAAEANVLNLFGTAKRSQPIPKYVAAPQAKNVKVGNVKVTIPNQGKTTEIYASKPVKLEEAMMRIEKFLGPGPYTNIHPRTGEIDNNRIVSKDGLRSIRYGDHEINSSPTKHHYHEETWCFDKVNNCMNVENVVVRVPLVTPKKNENESRN